MLLLSISALFYAFTAESYQLIETLSIGVREWFGQFYLVLGLLSVVLLVVVAFSKWGTYKLGKIDEKPAFSNIAWISMLYSAGMGAGILLRAVQEPVFMQQNPPIQNNVSTEIKALEFTFYQWGFTAWAFYALFALAIGTVAFKYGRPLITSSSVFDTKKYSTKSRFKNLGIALTDLLTILTTVFGLVAAVALGSSQIKGGLDHLLGLTLNANYSIALILFIGFLALLSALSGVEKGIKIISTANIYLTLALLIFVFLQTDMLLILKQYAHALYRYLIDFIPMSLALGAFDPGKKFLTDWTYYYWAFWLAWAPFTGLFIARISRGRTIREIILGVLLIPSLGSFFWFTVFGQSAFEMINAAGEYKGEFDNVFTSLFIFLSHYPAQSIVNTIVVILLVSFLVTSLDSAILVLSMFTSKNTDTPSKKHRIVWSTLLTICAIGIVLLSFAKKDEDVLSAVQKLLIITSLPLSFFMIVMSFKWIQNLNKKEC
ncbi:BCCT family transporter [Leeuwenhoekiella polynyae]|uniref:BCCT family transporter n=1 Tax=Leeuwenhoekiella polynyae TaxID=1550906 RepID=UPI000FFEC9F6|nr:BCCT family transporter [Leeuwenhoekiella polynyae]